MSKFIILDTETTGTADEDKIIQLGFLELDGGKCSVYNDFCSSEIDIKIEAMETHGITPDMIEKKPICTQTKSYKRLLELNKDSNYLIIHNAKFDINMLCKEGFVNNMRVIDTLKCAKHLYKDVSSHRLQYLRYYLKLYENEKQEAAKLNIEIKAHDAIGDVLVLKLFLTKLKNKIKDTFAIENGENVVFKMLELTQTHILVEKFNFGKYKGKYIKDIIKNDANYINWLKNQDIDEDLKYSIDYLSKIN